MKINCVEVRKEIRRDVISMDYLKFSAINIHRPELCAYVGVTLGEPPHFRLDESARELSCMAKPR